MPDTVHAVGTIIENERGEILVLKRHKHDPEGNTWGLVGGKIDPGETKEQAAVREIKEEINLKVDIDDLEFLQTFHWNRSDLNIIFDVFKLSFKKNSHYFVLPENEITDYMWELPENLNQRSDLMIGLYDILKNFIHD